MSKKKLIWIDCDNEMKIFLKIEVDWVGFSILWLCDFIYK